MLRPMQYEEFIDFLLPAGSLIYMDQQVQDKWQHTIPSAGPKAGRMSFTFRRIKRG
jgi:hypothetical protein